MKVIGIRECGYIGMKVNGIRECGYIGRPWHRNDVDPPLVSDGIAVIQSLGRRGVWEDEKVKGVAID